MDFCSLGMASWIQLKSPYYCGMEKIGKSREKNRTVTLKHELPDEVILVIANMIEGKSNAFTK